MKKSLVIFGFIFLVFFLDTYACESGKENYLTENGKTFCLKTEELTQLYKDECTNNKKEYLCKLAAQRVSESEKKKFLNRYFEIIKNKCNKNDSIPACAEIAGHYERLHSGTEILQIKDEELKERIHYWEKACKLSKTVKVDSKVTKENFYCFQKDFLKRYKSDLEKKCSHEIEKSCSDLAQLEFKYKVLLK